MNRTDPAFDSAGSLFYVGRFRDIKTPPGSLRLDSWDVLPVHLGPLLEDAERLTILDPMSFPFDAMRDADRDIPVGVALPGWRSETLGAVLGEPLFEEITPFDRIRLADEETWRALRSQYRWPEAVRVSGRLEAVRSRPRKSAHRRLRRAVVEQLRTARRGIPVGEMLSVLLLADDQGEWRSAAESAQASVRTELPDDSGPPETVHASLAIGALCARDQAERMRRLAALARALRVGGRLIVVDRFLDGSEGRTTPAPRPRELMAEIQAGSSGHVVLEHVEALRLRGDELASVGVFAFSKVGRPERL